MAALLDESPARPREPIPCYGPRVTHLLRGYLARCGETQSDIARRIGMRPNTLCRIALGYRRTTRRNLLLIARAAGCTRAETDGLLAAAGYAPAWADTPAIRDLVYVLREGAPEERAAIRQAVSHAADRVRSRSCLSGINTDA